MITATSTTKNSDTHLASRDNRADAAVLHSSVRRSAHCGHAHGRGPCSRSRHPSGQIPVDRHGEGARLGNVVGADLLHAPKLERMPPVESRLHDQICRHHLHVLLGGEKEGDGREVRRKRGLAGFFGL